MADEQGLLALVLSRVEGVSNDIRDLRGEIRDDLSARGAKHDALEERVRHAEKAIEGLKVRVALIAGGAGLAGSGILKAASAFLGLA